MFCLGKDQVYIYYYGDALFETLTYASSQDQPNVQQVNIIHNIHKQSKLQLFVEENITLVYTIIETNV
jgi:hypothetical protein